MSKHLRGRLLFLSLVCSFPLISSSPLNLETNFFEEGPSNYTKLLKEIKQLDLTAITNQLLEIAEGGFRSKQILKDTLLLHRRLQRKQPLDLVLIDKSLEEIAELKIVLELEEARLRELNLEKKRQQERLFNLVFNLLELIKNHQELTTLLEEIKTSELVYDLTEINLLGATTRGVGWFKQTLSYLLQLSLSWDLTTSYRPATNLREVKERMALARLKREQLRESLRPRIEQLKSNFVDNLNLFKGKIKELSSDEGLLGDFSLLLEGLLPLSRELELVEDLGETNNNQQRLLNSLAGRANFSWQLPNLLLEFLPHFNLSNSFNFARELETRNSKQWIFRDTRRNFLFKNIWLLQKDPAAGEYKIDVEGQQLTGFNYLESCSPGDPLGIKSIDPNSFNKLLKEDWRLPSRCI